MRLESPISVANSASSESFLSSPIHENTYLDRQDHEGKTQLHHAVLGESLKEVEHLLSIGATVDIQDNKRNHALHYAAGRGFHGIIGILLKWKADVNAIGSEKKTPLHAALQYPKAFRALLKAHPILSAQDERGDTALHLAISALTTSPLKGKIVEKLLSLGADVNVRNNAGVTPFHMVVSKTRPRARDCNPYITMFLGSNANISLRTNDDELPFAVFLEKSSPYWMRKSHRYSGIQEVDASSIFKAFIRSGADPNTRLKSGEVILHEHMKSCFLDDEEASEIFFNTVNIHEQAIRGDFPLHSGVRNFWRDRLSGHHTDILLQRGADPNQVNSDGDSPIMVLLKSQAKSKTGFYVQASIQKVLEALLDGGADAMQRDSAGDLPIYLVTKKCTGEAQKKLTNLLIDSFIYKDMRVDQSLEYQSDERWWRQYHILRQRRRWTTTTHHLISGEGMPADVANILPKILLDMAAAEILPDVKAKLIELKENLGLRHADTQAERDHFVLILRDCKSLKLDIEPNWYQFLLELFD